MKRHCFSFKNRHHDRVVNHFLISRPACLPSRFLIESETLDFFTCYKDSHSKAERVLQGFLKSFDIGPELAHADIPSNNAIGTQYRKEGSRRLVSSIQRLSNGSLEDHNKQGLWSYGYSVVLLFLLTRVIQLTVVDPSDTVSEQSRYFFDSIVQPMLIASS
ncbi:hypothetical protein C8J56DRAFT_145064 [Mycena floridula]|nr:hypothetical protein C8J56DRAFT_145064 [Mycena floridula]